MSRKPYMSRNRLFLVGRRRQKGDCFPLPLLAIKLGKKLLGGVKKKGEGQDSS